jgi:hypothetical protein
LVQKAYYAFLYAEAKNEKRLEDIEAYNWLQEHGIDPKTETCGELADYQLPAFDTWSRYLRTARKAVGEQKYTPRRVPPPGTASSGATKPSTSTWGMGDLRTIRFGSNRMKPDFLNNPVCSCLWPQV